MPPTRRINVLVASSDLDADFVKMHFPQFRLHAVLTPTSSLGGVKISEYIWTPDASDLPASVRMGLRGALAPLLDSRSFEEVFPSTLLSW